MAQYDVALIGLGAMGAAAAQQLAKRGARVIGFDRFAPPHVLGSSHGGTRVTRLAIGEGDHLTPLAMRSHQLWREIEHETGTELVNETGLLVISSDNNAAQTHVSGFFGKTVAAAEKFGIAHELLGAAQIRRRWPQFQVRDDEIGYFEPSGGFVRPEACVRAQLALARRRGAQLHFEQRVLHFESDLDCATLKTGQGRYTADKLIIAAGAWLPELLPQYARLFKIYRQVQLWFETADAAAFAPGAFSVFIWELPNSTRGLYGFPAIDDENAIKVASEEFLAPTTPEQMNREVSAAEIDAVRELVTRTLKDITQRCVKATACLYTVTPDFGFVIDTHPESDRVIIASPCSGHGFKHSPAIGEALADLALGQPTGFDLSPFRLKRLSS